MVIAHNKGGWIQPPDAVSCTALSEWVDRV